MLQRTAHSMCVGVCVFSRPTFNLFARAGTRHRICAYFNTQLKRTCSVRYKRVRFPRCTRVRWKPELRKWMKIMKLKNKEGKSESKYRERERSTDTRLENNYLQSCYRLPFIEKQLNHSTWYLHPAEILELSQTHAHKHTYKHWVI